MRTFGLFVLLALQLSAAAVDSKLLDGLEWRSIGPAVMGGRISDLDGVPGDPTTMFAAAGSGGLFVTRDGGMTWKPIFDLQSTISIGAIAVQHDNPKVIWVGTGESNVRNSVSFGDGVYKSEDGGQTWKCVGLTDTQTISRILIHPKNPNIVYVAAVGHPFGPNAERGVFVTEDGGNTWRKSLFIDNDHGAADLEMDPANPDILYAGMWHFDRKPWTYTSGSEKGGVFRSTDAGRTWKKLTNGLPPLMGRIGVKVAPADSKIVYVIAESKEGTLFRSQDRGETFTKVSEDRELVGRGYYYCDMRVAPDNADRIFVLTDALLQSNDAGKSFRRISPKVHGDLHALWIDPKDPRRIWQGHDGGLSVSYDAGGHWEQINNIPLGQFYRVSADTQKPFYKVIGGLQDNGSWIGPSQTREPGGVFNDDWRMVNGIVGFAALIDPDDPNIVLTETPGGGLLRTDLRTREQQSVSPQPRSYSGAPASEWKYRFGWDAPLVRSPFGKKTIYFAGNVIFQSSDYGRTWENISPDLTTKDASRMGNIGGPVWVDNSSSEIYSTISAFAESPAKRGVLWAGTDDGNLQVSFNGGGKWSNVPPNVRDARVSHVEPSRSGEMTTYASLDRHMFDDFHPYIYKTEDGGKSWVNVGGNLPEKAFVWTVREDARNPRVLYAGTELGIYASVSGGGDWFPLHLKNLPWAVAVRDIVQQSDTNDLIIATHGRSIWVLDDAAVIGQLADAIQQDAYLFDMRPAIRYSVRAMRFGYGDKTFTGMNALYGAQISYYVSGGAGAAKLQVLDAKGAVVRELDAISGPGVHRVAWDLRYASGPQALPGAYTVRLSAGGREMEKKLEVRLDPSLQVSEDDLVSQFETSRKLREMSAAVRATGKFARPRGMGRSETGPRLAENLEALYGLVDAANAAPTPAMLRYFAELETEFKATMAQ
jgi:photosystem II stability/assembly factor-like uncharacterized protein